MRQKKVFNAPAPIEVTPAAPEFINADSLLINLPENPTDKRSINFTPWLGKGIDAWVWACTRQLQVFLSGKTVTPSTVSGYSSGMRNFFEFLQTSNATFDPQGLRSQHILLYIDWIKNHEEWSYGTQKLCYNNTKSVIVAMVRRGVIQTDEDLFPANPFPGSNRRTKGAEALSQAERLQLSTALRDDIIAIHKGSFEGTDSSAMAVLLLAIALRTGANLSPLLEASRDCLRDHAFMPNMKVMELFKRRGNATKLLQLRYSNLHEGSLIVPMDGVALLRKALLMSEGLLTTAKPEHKNRVWLYRPATKKGPITGKTNILTSKSLSNGIAALVERHSLMADDGQPLRVNLSRLRKTLEHRLWALSGGDLITTAALMGHNPKTADIHYLACTQQMRENATFVGEAIVSIYRAGALMETEMDAAVLPGKSPTGRCKDPYNGDKAPKNGEPCDDFFSCFNCKSYAIVGSPEDLHRLFSFYWFLEREMNHARTHDWRTEFRCTMTMIDNFTQDKFDKDVVAEAKKNAQTNPIKFWASYTLSNRKALNG